MNVSSVIVRTKDENYQRVLKSLSNSGFCEVHFFERNKIVVTIEGKTIDQEISKLKKIEQTEGVIAAEMVYAYSEFELEKERNNIDMAEPVPDWLNDDTVMAQQIKYKGDLKKKI